MSAKHHWLVTLVATRSRDGKTFYTDATTKHPADYLAETMELDPDASWALVFAIPITAAQAKKF